MMILYYFNFFYFYFFKKKLKFEMKSIFPTQISLPLHCHRNTRDFSIMANRKSRKRNSKLRHLLLLKLKIIFLNLIKNAQPYPDEAALAELSSQCGLSSKQVKDWLMNGRRRHCELSNFTIQKLYFSSNLLFLLQCQRLKPNLRPWKLWELRFNPCKNNGLE